MVSVGNWAKERILLTGPGSNNWEEIRGIFKIETRENAIIVQPPNEPSDSLQRVAFNLEFVRNGMARRFMGSKCNECGYQYMTLFAVTNELGMGVLGGGGVISTACRRCWQYVPKQDEFHYATETDDRRN